MPAEGGYTFADVCETDRRPRARAPRGPGRRRARRRATCRDDRPTRAARSPDARPARRAPARSAAPRPGCPRSGPARRSRCSSRPRRSTASPPRPRSTSTSSRSTARRSPTEARDPATARTRPRARTCSGSRPARSRRRSRELPTVADADGRRPPAGDPRASTSTSASRSSSGGSATGAAYVDADGPALRRGADRRRRATSPACRSSTTSAPARRARGRLDARPGRPRRRHPARLARRRPTSAAPRPSCSVVRHRRERLRARAPAEGGWSAVFGFYTPSLRTPELDPRPGPAAAQPARPGASDTVGPVDPRRRDATGRTSRGRARRRRPTPSNGAVNRGRRQSPVGWRRSSRVG